MGRAGAERVDWHPADIQAALKRAGWTLRAVGEAAGYRRSDSAWHVLRIPMPRVEAQIAAILGKSAPEIWPSRYADDGLPLGWRGRRQMLSVKTHESNPHPGRGRGRAA